MKKNNFKETAKNIQVKSDKVPADILFSDEKINERSKNETINNDVRNAFEIMKKFQELSPVSQEAVLKEMRSVISQNNEQNHEGMIDIAEASELLNVSKRTINNYIASDKLIGHKIGRKWYFPIEDVQRLKK